MVEARENGKGLNIERSSAVRVMLTRSGKGGTEILLGRRVGGKYHDYWSLLGGKIDEGEDPKKAAGREMKEEADVDLQPEDLIHLTEIPSTVFRDEEDCTRMQRDIQSIVFLASADSQEPRNVSPEEHSDIGWFLIDDKKSGVIKNPPGKLTPTTVEAVRQYVDRKRIKASEPKDVYIRPQDRKTG